MKAFEYIKEIKDIAALSPLRQESKKRLIFGNPQSELGTIMSELDLLANKCFKPLKVVIMGEVKAGKSTRLNALAGGKVSPTDVSEATASIFEISYAKEEQAAIKFIDGTSVDGTPEDIFSLLSQKQNDQQFFSRCRIVELKLPLSQLTKLTIVDTPGLATITQQNSSRTQRYFQQADVVLWVFNGHYLGQNDVTDELEKVAELGKPIVGIINRIEELEGERDKYVRYVKRELGIYLRDVFPLSASQAFEALMSNNKSELTKSGYHDLLYYMENKLERQAENVHNDSLVDSAKAVIGRELLLHQGQLTELTGKLLIIKKSKEKVKHQSEYIRQHHQNTVRAWFGQEFLADKERILNEKIQSLSLMSMKSNEAEIKDSIQKFFSEQSIREEIGRFMVRLDNDVRNDWEIGLNTIHKELTLDYNKLISQYQVNAQAILEQLPTAGKSALAGAGEGAVAAGVFGGAMATYAAVIGPAATKITLTSALSAMMPPLLIAGAAAGALTGLIKYSKVKTEYLSTVTQSVEQLREDMRSRFMPEILKAIDFICQSVVDRIQEQLLAESFNGTSEKEVSKYQIEIEQYCRKLENKL